MTVAPAMLVQRTERGDEMFLTTFARYAQQVLDLDSLELLPEPGSGRPPALRPEPVDEGRHAPGPEELWNESWYFDLVSDDAQTGLYTRLGLYPNLGVSWVTAFVCGPERATVAVVDFEAPLPEGERLDLDREGLRVEHACEEPLQRFRVRLSARGERFADPAALLRGERGEPVEVEFDLVWETLGDPYAYRVATRYEIPCRVHGSVAIDGQAIELAGLGQRDHSWGPRDWWSAEWMWSAGHLEDGTRLHGVEFRVPGAPPLGVGYLQPPEGGVQELDSRHRLGGRRRGRPDHERADRLRRARRRGAAARVRAAAAGGPRRPHLAVPARDVPAARPTTAARGSAGSSGTATRRSPERRPCAAACAPLTCRVAAGRGRITTTGRPGA